MRTFDVLVWEDTTSDGSIGYSAWCSYVVGVWGQGDTVEEALADITSAMADIIHYPWDDGVSLANPEEAAAKMADLAQRLSNEGAPYSVHQVPIPATEAAGV